jgi:hypothetical protein
VRVVTATPLLRDAAEVLAPLRDDVVVIGALAVQVALAGHDVALTPTRDVDAGVATDAVERVVSHLEAEGLHRSDLAHERAFTWVRDELKVQLLRPFHPFPKGAARGLPINNMITELDAHRMLVALDTAPEEGRFWVATPAALVGLKEAAFGRTRPDGEAVDRDFSDAALVIDRLADEMAEELADRSPMRGRVTRAARRLYSEDEATAAAAREFVRTGEEDTHAAAEASVRRAARRLLRLLGDE